MHSVAALLQHSSCFFDKGLPEATNSFIIETEEQLSCDCGIAMAIKPAPNPL